MNYVVTGSEGFIGKNLVNRLKILEHKVIESDIALKLDLFDLPDEVFEDADAIFHLACVNQEAAELENHRNIEVNAFGAQFLGEKAFEYGIPLIYTSTASVYGNAINIPTSSGETPHPKSKYAVAKLAGEHYIRVSGCDYKILRLSNVYGPHQTSDNPYCGVIGKFIENGLAKKKMKVIKPGTQSRDFTYVEDVVNALINHDLWLNSTANVASGVETTVLELASAIDSFFDVGFDFIEPRGVDKIDRRCLISSIQCPTTLRDGLEKTLEWHKNNGVSIFTRF